MIGLELVRDLKTKEPAAGSGESSSCPIRERGVLAGVGGVFGNVLRLQPPLSITAEECDRAVRSWRRCGPLLERRGREILRIQ